MDAFFLFAALTATASTAQSDTPAAVVPALADPSQDAVSVANALSEQPLVLSMRGTSVDAIAIVTRGSDSCTALVSAHPPGKKKLWSREFRWGDVAWLGGAADGRTIIAFFEPDGRLPADTVAFSPADARGFHDSLTRLSSACRARRGENERIAFGPSGPMRSCYFARLPALQLIDSEVASPASLPPRAMLSLLSRENPQGELQLLLERAAPDPTAGGDDWGAPIVAFVFADPRVKDMQIASASFALDAKPVTAQHAVAGYGDTRVRIIMDPFAPSATDKPQTSFYRRLTKSREVMLGLLDASGQSRAVLNFDVGPAVAAARKALSAADWSCTAATPAPTPAAHWQPVN